METDQTSINKYFANGKLMLAGEYFVLDGAVAFAVPTVKGQLLAIQKSEENSKTISWKSFDDSGHCWFEADYNLPDFDILQSNDSNMASRLKNIIQVLHNYRPDLFKQGLSFTTHLEFEKDWGFGSSSTLLSTLAQWTGVDPYELLNKTFGGSGYDIACARAKSPIFYKKNEEIPAIQKITFNPSFIDSLNLVWLGKKQDSRAAITRYRDRGNLDPGLIRQISQLSKMMAKSADLSTFCSCIQELERLTGDFLEMEPIQEKIFSAIPGAVKSLGAWGGDFALIASPWEHEKVKNYCSSLGLTKVFPFQEMVLL